MSKYYQCDRCYKNFDSQISRVEGNEELDGNTREFEIGDERFRISLTRIRNYCTKGYKEDFCDNCFFEVLKEAIHHQEEIVERKEQCRKINIKSRKIHEAVDKIHVACETCKHRNFDGSCLKDVRMDDDEDYCDEWNPSAESIRRAMATDEEGEEQP